MQRSMPVSDPSLLRAALEGLEVQRGRVEEQILEVRRMLATGNGASGRAPAKKSTPAKAKRELSDAARKRIARAQKKRWAKFRRTSKG